MFRRNADLMVLCCALATSLVGRGLVADEAARKSGIDRHNFDASVSPGDDFYEYVNGTWIKENPIPPEYARWGAFPKLRDDNLITLHEILEGLAKDVQPRNEEERKLRDFYRTAMDEQAVQKAGALPLAEWLKKIGAIKNRDELVVEAGGLCAVGIDAMFSFYVDQDEKQSERYAGHLSQ